MVQDRIVYDTNNARSTIAQVVASLGFSILSLNVGLIICMLTIVTGALRTQNSTLTLTEDEASWFGSLMFVVQPIGCLASGVGQDILGRKWCLLLINIPQLIAWIILYFANSVALLYTSVIVMGLSIGFLEAPVLSYIGETTQPRLRGVLGSLAGIFYNAGFMLETFLGATVPWRTMILWNLVGPLVGIIAMWLVPESPAFLVTKGRIREAEKSYQWLRGWVPKEVISEELQNMINYVKDTHPISKLDNVDYKLVPTKDGDKPVKEMSSKWRVLREPAVLTAFRIVLIYFGITACVSLIGMRPFFIEILDNLNLPIKSEYIVAICGGLQSLGTLSMALSIRFLGKRLLSFISLGLSIFSCLGLGFYIISGVNFAWLPLCLFAVSYYAATLGIMSVPWILAIELFPLRARGMAGAICGSVCYLFIFLVTKTYYSLVSFVDVSGCCFFYGIVGILGFIYLYVDMPETEGMSLELIEEELTERYRKKKSKQLNEL